MRKLVVLSALSCALVLLSLAEAQPPGFPGKKGGKGGFAPPQPGQILPVFLRDRLTLKDEQKKQLDALQKEVDARLAKILTDAQKKQLKDLAERGPGGFGPPPNDDPPPRSAEVTRPKPKDVAVTDATLRQAVEKSLPLLWKGLKGHTERRTCFTCHNHAVPMVAFVTARERGFTISDADLKEAVEFTTDFLERNRPRFLKGQGPGPLPEGGETDNTGYALFALEVAGKEPDQATAATVEYTLIRDRHLGYWWTPSPRPPSEASSFMTTALALRGIQKYGTAEQKERIDKRVESARSWLLRTKAKDTEDRVFRLIGLKSAGAKDEDVAAAVKELVASQRDDGGWGQTDAMEPDAYATGSALVALAMAGGMGADDPVYRRGLAYLLGTQREDGSWYVKTRSRPFQTYFESGFPHGRDQFISIAASGWATAALARGLPVKKASK